MIGDFFKAIMDGFLDSRRSVRRVMDGGWGMDAALAMLALSYLVSAAAQVLFAGPELIGEASTISRHIGGVLQTVIGFFLLCWLVHWLGRASGGVGDFRETTLAIAWHALVTSFLSPVMVLSVSAVLSAEARSTGPEPEISGYALLGLLATSGLWLWLLANYVSELHGFRNVLGVLAVLIGMIFAIAIFVTAAFGSLLIAA